ncbi:MAG: ABC transporter permease [Chloroflexi bacterium]|nr:ABC transporter permease [Chloroflexota bacterium]
MWAYVVRRLLLAIPTLLGVTVVVFLIMRVIGDESLRFNTGMTMSFETYQMIREELGLNKPLYEQYFHWLFDIVTLDFGRSILYNNAEMSALLARKVPLSLQVGLMGLLIGSGLGIIGGVIAALKQDTFTDYLIRGIAILGISVPTFWSGMMLILIFVRMFDWIPRQGYVPIWEDPAGNLAQLIWPALIIGLGFFMGTTLRMMRGAMLEVMSEDYIRTARAKGLGERVIITRHAMRNALIPVLTLVGMFLPITVTGLVVTEQVFGIPGVGHLMIDAINFRDFPVVQLLVTLSGIAVVMANLGVDMLYLWLYPRIRY